MSKKKESKHSIFSPRFFARIAIINMPAYFVLVLLWMTHQIGWQTVLTLFIVVTTIVVIITAIVFKELENFIGYLKSLNVDENAPAPRFHRGIFGSRRMVEAFLSVRDKWMRQTISDERILENLPDPLLMLDEEGKIVFANSIAVDFFGGDILGKTGAEFFDDKDALFTLGQVISEHKQNDWFEWVFNDEQVYIFRIRAELLPAKAKNNASVVLVFHDITPFKLFEKQQADFFANASHELKTPLSIVSGFIETLQGSAKDDEAARGKFLQMMGEQTARMTTLVQDLLALSKLQMMKKGVQNDVILIPSLLQNVIQDLGIRAEKNNKKLELKIPHDLPRLMGNKSELHKVFQNLIDNAIKYGDDHTTVTIKAILANSFPKKSAMYFDSMRQVLAVSIHNEGNPIPARDLSRLFERFYRMDTFKAKKVEGTGLGLGIVQQIIQHHEGMIDVVSSEEKGTVFTVYLPINL